MSRALSPTLTLRRVQGWHLLLALAAVVIGAYYWFVELGSTWAGAQVALYCSANGALAVSAALTARRHPSLATPMLFVAAGTLSSIAGDVVFYVLALVDGEVSYPGVADVAYLASFPLLATGLLILVRRRTPGWDGASGIDAAIVAISAGYLVFEFVIAPTMLVTSGNVTTLVSVAYPVGDLMLIVVGARLLLGAGPRPAPLLMLGGYLIMLLYADTVYSITILDGTYRAANYLDAIWMGASFVLAAALAHPSVPQMISRSSATTPDATPGRLAVLAVAAVLAPTGMAVQYLRGAEPHVLVAGAVCNLLFLLVLARMAGLVRAQRQAAITDGLTGLRSRRFFEQVLGAEAARAGRTGGEVSILLLDIDHFKDVNDTYGHSAGDRVLIEVAHRLSGLIRPGDLAARYGGEEFAVLLPATGPQQAREIAERVRHGIGEAPVALGESRPRRVTVSVGVAGMPPVTGVEDLVLAADRALYAAKGAGRDRVTIAA